MEISGPDREPIEVEATTGVDAGSFLDAMDLLAKQMRALREEEGAANRGRPSPAGAFVEGALHEAGRCFRTHLLRPLDPVPPSPTV